jgi:hypothetical protein
MLTLDENTTNVEILVSEVTVTIVNNDGKYCVFYLLLNIDFLDENFECKFYTVF